MKTAFIFGGKSEWCRTVKEPKEETGAQSCEKPLNV